MKYDCGLDVLSWEGMLGDLNPMTTDMPGDEGHPEVRCQYAAY